MHKTFVSYKWGSQLRRWKKISLVKALVALNLLMQEIGIDDKSIAISGLVTIFVHGVGRLSKG